MQKKMSDMSVISEKPVAKRVGGVRDAVMDVGQAAGISDKTPPPVAGGGRWRPPLPLRHPHQLPQMPLAAPSSFTHS